MSATLGSQIPKEFIYLKNGQLKMVKKVGLTITRYSNAFDHRECGFEALSHRCKKESESSSTAIPSSLSHSRLLSGNLACCCGQAKIVDSTQSERKRETARLENCHWMKPPVAVLLDRNDTPAIKSDSNSQSITVSVNDESSTLRSVLRPLLERWLGGINVTLVLLGSSDSQKADLYHTITNKDAVFPVLFETAFDLASESGQALKIELTALQVFGELLRDIMDQSNDAVYLTHEGFNVKAVGLTKRVVQSSMIGLESLSVVRIFLGRLLVHKNNQLANSSTSASLAATTELVFIDTEREVVTNPITQDKERVKCTFTVIKLLGSELLCEDPNRLLLQEGPVVSHSIAVLIAAINTVALAKGRFDFDQSKLTMALSQALGGNSLTSYLVCLRADSDTITNGEALKLAQRLGRIESNPVCLTSGIRNLLSRTQQSSGREEKQASEVTEMAKSYTGKQYTGLLHQNKLMKKDLDALQAYVLEATTKFNELKLAYAALESSCQTVENDRLTMKDELLIAKIELSKAQEQINNKTGNLNAQLGKTEEGIKKLEQQLQQSRKNIDEVTMQLKGATDDRDKTRAKLEDELKTSAGLSKRLKLVELKNKEISLELVGMMATKNNYDRHNETHKLELERLRKQRRFTLEQEALKQQIRDMETKREDAESALTGLQELAQAKENALNQTHSAETNILKGKIESIEIFLADSKQSVNSLRQELDVCNGHLNKAVRENDQLKQTVSSLESKHSLATEHYRSKLDKLTQDVASIANKKDAALVSKQIFKEMLESYTLHEKQLQEELSNLKQKLNSNQEFNASNAPVVMNQQEFYKKLKEFTMNIQYKLESDRTSLLTRAIVAEELLKQHNIFPDVEIRI
ncbi:hypothetical protein BC830DRAFT_1081123 [Chytriomyces sp. MP71]|nr:hypothetical protein BC830DRAFT_1081123 [Chytriomyces sp. MP71]